jgi:carbonic anhydrase
MSYGLTVDILADVLPMQTNTRSVALNMQKVAEKKEEELAEEQVMFAHYIEVNQNFIPNCRERYQYNETITTAFVESTINWVVSKRMVKKQQMRWTKRGAHL